MRLPPRSCAGLSLRRDAQLLQKRRDVDVVRRAALDVGHAAVLAPLTQEILAQARSFAGVGDLLERRRRFAVRHVTAPLSGPQ